MEYMQSLSLGHEFAVEFLYAKLITTVVSEQRAVVDQHETNYALSFCTFALIAE